MKRLALFLVLASALASAQNYFVTGTPPKHGWRDPVGGTVMTPIKCATPNSDGWAPCEWINILTFTIPADGTWPVRYFTLVHVLGESTLEPNPGDVPYQSRYIVYQRCRMNSAASTNPANDCGLSDGFPTSLAP